MKKLLFLSLSILYTLNTVAQSLNLINYSVREGLPQSQVFAMSQDSKGYLWFGTQGGGLGRFDGKNFEQFSSQKGLPSDYVLAIHEAKDKTLWVGTNKGAAKMSGEQFTTATFADKETHAVSAIATGNSGELFFGTERGIFQWDEKTQKINKRTFQNNADKAMIFQFLKDEKGVFIATSRGAFWINSAGKCSEISQIPTTSVQAISKDTYGNFWFSTYGQGVFVLNINTLQILKIIKNTNTERALCSFAAIDGKVWIGTEHNGISIFSATDTLQKNIKENDNLPSNHVRAIFKDPWNNIWIGTSGGGVAKLLEQNFKHFNTKNGLPSDRIYAIAEDKSGKIWAASGNDGVVFYDKNIFNKSLQDSFLIGIKSKTIAADSAGQLWIGTEGNGIIVINSAENKRLTVADGLPSNWIKSIVIDKQNNVWAATQSDGIAFIKKRDAKSYIVQTFKVELPDLFISTLQIDAQNRLWFATKNAYLGYMDKGKVIKVFSKENGLPDVAIRSLTFDNQGNIYVGTAGEGIFYAKNTLPNLTFQPLKTSKYYSKNVYLLLFDKQQNLWSGCENGIDKFSFDEEKNVNGTAHFGKNEGFLGIETCQNAALCDRNGNLWFGTLNGLTQHFPNVSSQKTSAPMVHLEKISLFYQPLQSTPFANFLSPSGTISSGLCLPHHQNNLGFDFKGIHLNSDLPMQYRWMLKGAETQWSPVTTQSAVNYAKLSPGDYVFMVQATVDGVNFSPSVEAPFSIEKPFWERWWFRILALALVAFAVWAVVKQREKKIKAEAEAIRSQLEMKNKMLELEQKALQLQMNPHFIFNALNSIQGLVSEKSFQEARLEINNFAQLMRSILSNSRKPFISLEEEINTLDRYLKMEQLCQKNTFTYDIKATQNIDKEELMLPSMLLQPFVENAIIHGIAHLQHEGIINISFDLQQDILYCVISDNGVGRTRAAELQGAQRKGHQSTALAVTTERLETMSKDKSKPTLLISDVLDKNEKVCGTKVEVFVAVEVL